MIVRPVARYSCPLSGALTMTVRLKNRLGPIKLDGCSRVPEPDVIFLLGLGWGLVGNDAMYHGTGSSRSKLAMILIGGGYYGLVGLVTVTSAAISS